MDWVDMFSSSTIIGKAGVIVETHGTAIRVIPKTTWRL
jgi:hypothetical protein